MKIFRFNVTTGCVSKQDTKIIHFWAGAEVRSIGRRVPMTCGMITGPNEVYYTNDIRAVTCINCRKFVHRNSSHNNDLILGANFLDSLLEIEDVYELQSRIKERLNDEFIASCVSSKDNREGRV